MLTEPADDADAEARGRRAPVVEILLGVALLTTAGAVIAARLGADVPLEVVVPGVVVVTGAALAWRQFDALRNVRAPGSSGLVVRALGALVLVVLGILLFFTTSSRPNAWTVLTAAVAVLLPIFLVPARYVGRRLARLRREASDLNASMNDQMTERFNAGGATLVKLFGRPDAESTEFRTRAGRVRDIGVRTALLMSVFMNSLTLVSTLALALVYGLGGWFALNGTMDAGSVVALALLLNQRMRGRSLVRVLIFVPYVISEVIVGTGWGLMLRTTGSINALLDQMGLTALSVDWLANPDVAIWSLMIIITWKYIGFAVILFLAGLQSIPEELFEAAAIDGASYWQIQRRITLPLLAPTLRIWAFLSIIGSLQLFDLVYIIWGQYISATAGTSTMATYLVANGRGSGNYGYGNAVAVVLFLVSLVVALVYQRFVLNRDTAGALTGTGRKKK